MVCLTDKVTLAH